MAKAKARIATAGGSSPDVLVVGGGVIGASISFELASRGMNVTLVERDAELGRGCSGGNLGLLCPGHSAPLATPDSLKLGFRYLLDPAGPLYLRPRARLPPWLARYNRLPRSGHLPDGTRGRRPRRRLGEPTRAWIREPVRGRRISHARHHVGTDQPHVLHDRRAR